MVHINSQRHTHWCRNKQISFKGMKVFSHLLWSFLKESIFNWNLYVCYKMFRNSSQPRQYISFTHFVLTVSVPVTIFGFLKQSLFSAIFSSLGEVTHHQGSKENKFLSILHKWNKDQTGKDIRGMLLFFHVSNLYIWVSGENDLPGLYKDLKPGQLNYSFKYQCLAAG